MRANSWLSWVLGLAFPVFPSAQPQENLLMQLPLDGNALDAGPNGFDAENFGAAPTTDRFGGPSRAMGFTGGAFILLPDEPELKPQPPFSLSIWLRFSAFPEDGAGAILTTDFVPNAYFGVTLSVDNQRRLAISVGGRGDAAGATMLQEATWYHVVVVIPADGAPRLYVNGCEDTLVGAIDPVEFVVYSEDGAGHLARGNAGRPPRASVFEGSLDDFRYWNAALSKAEVDALYRRFYSPEISLGADTMICIGEMLELRPQTTLSRYEWNDGSFGPTLTVSETGRYWVSAETEDCQIVSDTIDVMAGFCDQCEPVAPNVFTPNGDGRNDTFRVLFHLDKCRIVDYRVMIFNRWGQKVYESNNANDAWDGAFQAKPLPSDVYIYMARYAFESEQGRVTREIKGDLTLLR
jgi:gliding motility-associated-like protein